MLMIRSRLLMEGKISHATEWVSSKLFPQRSLPFQQGLFFPIPRFKMTRSHPCPCPQTHAARSKAIDVIIQYKQNQYHLLKIDMSKEEYNYDVARAIKAEYSRYRSSTWRLLSFKSLASIEYVKVSSCINNQPFQPMVLTAVVLEIL